MLDDLLDLAADILFEVAERKSMKKSTSQVLTILALVLAFAGIVCYFLFD